MDNQHKLIKGYRDLTQQEIDLMNKIKEQGEGLRLLCDEVAACPVTVDGRWLSIAKTDLQKGIMALIRSVAQPTTF
jgi:hypothetical protein